MHYNALVVLYLNRLCESRLFFLGIHNEQLVRSYRDHQLLRAHYLFIVHLIDIANKKVWLHFIEEDRGLVIGVAFNLNASPWTANIAARFFQAGYDLRIFS